MDKLLKLLNEKLGDEVFTEEVQEDFRTRVEVMINEQVDQRVKPLVEEEKQKLEEKYQKDAEEFKTEFVEQVDAYLDYAVSEFFKENKVAIESEYKVKAANELIEQFCAVLENNNFLVEPSKNKSLDELGKRVKTLEAKLNESVKESMKSKGMIREYKKALMFKEATSKLTKQKVEDLKEMMKGLTYKDEADFKKKLSICIEKVKTKKDDIVTEDIEKKDDLGKEVVTEKKQKSEIDKYL